MGLFGDLDAAAVNSNPFFVAQDDYEAVVSKAEYRVSRDGQRQLYIEYTITDVNSEYQGQKLQKYFPLVAEDMNEQKMALLPPNEKKEIQKNNAALKRALCGNEGSANQPGLGVNPDDLNSDDWKPESLINTPVIVAVQNYGPNNQGVAVKWANVIQDPSDLDK